MLLFNFSKTKVFVTNKLFSSEKQDAKINAIVKKAETEHSELVEKNTKRALKAGMSLEYLAEKAGTTLAEIEAEIAQDEQKEAEELK